MCARLGGRAVGRPRSDRHLTASTTDPDGGGTRSSEEARHEAESAVGELVDRLAVRCPPTAGGLLLARYKRRGLGGC